MDNAPELLSDKEVATILALFSLLERNLPEPNQVQQAYQVALSKVEAARKYPGYPLQDGWKRP
jgi:hypothetical protein